jgi:hypothetical protein
MIATGKRFTAIVRGDDDALHIREFESAAQAARAACERELQQPNATLTGISTADLAREFGLHPKTVRRAWARGELPGIEHSRNRVLIPRPIANLARRYGMARVCHWIKELS